jgi:hypothetical protein
MALGACDVPGRTTCLRNDRNGSDDVASALFKAAESFWTSSRLFRRSSLARCSFMFPISGLRDRVRIRRKCC